MAIWKGNNPRNWGLAIIMVINQSLTNWDDSPSRKYLEKKGGTCLKRPPSGRYSCYKM